MKSPENIQVNGSNILVVDDDGMIRKLLRRILEHADFQVEEANSGEEAIAIVSERQPDLILLDVMMDSIDGFTACRKIKEMPMMGEVPIIFVTSCSDTSSVVEGLDAGGSDYVTKPVNRHEALARIRNHLKMRALMRLQQEFIDGLKRANLAKNRIIGVASHDLRNPLVSIRGLSEFLSEIGPLTDEQLDIAKTIQTTSHSMLEMVDELLDLSVIESREERVELLPSNVRELIESSIHIYIFAGSKKNIMLTFEKSEIPDQLMIDKMQFRRLVDNLLSNAVKYSPVGSNVRVIAQTMEDKFQIIVEDQGPGIPENEMHVLFTDFGRTSAQPTGNETSTGLGLAICRKIAEMHFGRIYAENRTEVSGARFIVELSLSKLAVPSE